MMGWDECVFTYKEEEGIDNIREKISRNPRWDYTKFHHYALCRNEKEAGEYIEENYDYSPHAVRFYDLKEGVKLNSPLLQELNDEWDSLQTRLDRLTGRYYNPEKTPAIVCPCCDETIKTDEVSWYNKCPACGGDVRPREVFKELKEVRRRLSEVKEKYTDEYNRLWDECEDKEIWWYGRYVYNIDSEQGEYYYD